MRRSSSGENENDEKYNRDHSKEKIKNNLSMSSNTSMLPRNPSGTFKNSSDEKPKSPYGAFTHQMRKIVPEDMACRLGCNGEKCKYCNSDWPESDMALNGIFSHWITDDIIAMARPTTAAIKNHKIIDQMRKFGIKSLFNLQMINEHKTCGKRLEKSGFSYDPNEFLKNDIYYYNFGFQDYSTVNMPSMVDMVKVFSFAVKQGKVAVHCHAGLGRTGLFIASYLIYSFRMSAKDAINYIRDKRKKSVQMNDQIEAIEKFENFLKPLRVIFANNHNDRQFSLNTFLCRQRYFLHGYEARTLKYKPKILFVCVERLRQLLNVKIDKNRKIDKNKELELSDNEDLNKMSSLYVQQIVNGAQKKLNQQFVPTSVRASNSSAATSIALALSSYSFDKHVIKVMELYEDQLNNDYEAYDKILDENDPNVIVALIWHWLDHLQIPPLREQEIIVLAKSKYEDNTGEIVYNWDHLDKGTYQTIECTLDIYRDLVNNTEVLTGELQEKIVFNLISVLTHAAIPTHQDLSSKGSRSSLSTFNDLDDNGGDDDDDRNKEKLINHTNRLKKQHLRTIYHAIMTLLYNPPKASSLSSYDDTKNDKNVDFYKRNDLFSKISCDLAQSIF